MFNSLLLLSIYSLFLSSINPVILPSILFITLASIFSTLSSIITVLPCSILLTLFSSSATLLFWFSTIAFTFSLIFDKYVYKYPIDIVTQTHLSKYPTDKEKFVTGIKILERKTDIKSGIDFRKSIAICVNVIPSILRMIPVLNEPAVILEESSWLDTKTHHLNIKARNVTWANYANMTEQSSYTVHETNPKWTNFKQYGRIDINGLGPFGRVIEMFAKKFLDDGAKRSLKVMEELIQERLSQQSTTRTTKSGINVDSS